jgi:ribose transport system permease protein
MNVQHYLRMARLPSQETFTTWAPLVVLVALLLGIAAIKPGFLGVNSALLLIEDAALIAVLALGQTYVIMLGSIDLSVAALASLSAVMVALLLPMVGPAALLLVLVVAALAGALQGYLHAKAQVPSFIVTLGGMGLFFGIAMVMSNAQAVRLIVGYEFIGGMWDRTLDIPNRVIVAGIAIGLVGALVHWSPVGRRITAIGQSELASIMSGVRTVPTKTVVFALSGLSAALAAFLLVAQMGSGAPTMMETLLLPSIAAVVIGGTAITGGVGGIKRTVIGALIVTVLRVGMAIIGVDAMLEQIVYGVLAIAAVAVTMDRSRVLSVK